jgi:putative ABC transport system ATP-binding protein
MAQKEQSAIAEDVVFKVSKLTKVYEIGEVKVHALRGIDLELYSGELIVLLGLQGAGSRLS